MKIYGETRSPSKKARFDKGVARPSARKEGSEADFLRKRRQAVELGTQHAAGSGVGHTAWSSGVGHTAWTPQHQKELDFQKQKLLKRKAQALECGHLTAEDQSAELAAYAENEQAKRAKRDAARLRAEVGKRDLAKGGGADLQCLRGLRVHGASKLDEQVRTRFAFCDAPSRVGADVIIVDDLSNPGERAEWAATLQGSYLVTSTTLQDMRGAQLKYQSALNSKRQIWLSDEFQAKHSAIAAIIKECIAASKSKKMSLIETEAAFLHSKAVANRQKEPRQVLGLVTRKEKEAKGGNYTTSSEAISFMKNLDYKKCTQGMSGR